MNDTKRPFDLVDFHEVMDIYKKDPSAWIGYENGTQEAGDYILEYAPDYIQSLESNAKEDTRTIFTLHQDKAELESQLKEKDADFMVVAKLADDAIGQNKAMQAVVDAVRDIGEYELRNDAGYHNLADALAKYDGKE